MKQFAIYILTSKYHTVLYTGVTNNLIRRVAEHKSKHISGFTQQYNVTKLVYYELTDNLETAIMREKQIKNLVRRKKIAMITSLNSAWKDLYGTIL